MPTQNQPESDSMDEHVLKALNHPMRREILLELYEHGLGGYSELSNVLKLKPGAFYHHIRLLEESNLVKQSSDKAYEITYKGYQALEFLRSNLPPIRESKLVTWLTIFDPISNMIEKAPILTLVFQVLIFIIGDIWFALNQQSSFIGYFIFSFDNLIFSILFSFIFSSTGLIGTWILLTISSRRVISKICLAAHVFVPQTFFISIAVALSLTPFLIPLISLQSFMGFGFTIFFQFLGLLYLLHVLQKNRVRALEKIIIGLLILQYWNLMLIYLFT